MKLTLPSVALGLATLGSAQYDTESKPFRLVLVSKNHTINGQTLSACHSGAAIESLCLSKLPSTSKPDPIAAATFRFNTSADTQPPSGSDGAPGILTYKLQSSPPIPSSMQFSYDPTNNYALPLMFPGTGADTQTLSFDKKGLLNIQGYVNYTTSPPTAMEAPKAFYNWYACQTYYSGYEYPNLVWALGGDKPLTPGCAKVDVKRVWV